MAIENIAQRIAGVSNPADATDIRIAINALYDALYAVATRLDNDAGVTDTAYRSDIAAIVVKG